MRPHDPAEDDRRALPLDPVPWLKRPDDGALEVAGEQRRGGRAERVHNAETVGVAVVGGGADDAVDAGAVVAAGQEGERLAGQEGGGQPGGAGRGAGGQVGGVLDGDPGVGLGVEGLQAGRVADDEGEEAEVLVGFGVDGGRGGGVVGAVVAEHADEGWGAGGGGQGGAGGYEGGEDVRAQAEGVGDGGHDGGQEGAGEVPGGAELVDEGLRAVGGGFDGHDAFFVGDLREAFLACGGAAGGAVGGLFGAVGG